MAIELEQPQSTGVTRHQLSAQHSHRVDDLASIIRAYNEVTEKLQLSHESLRLQADQLQRELASTDAQLQRSKRLAALGEMAAGIAHEIRNPLAAIQLYAGMLVEDLDTLARQQREQQEHTLMRNACDTGRKIADAVRGLNAIVSDVLSFSRELKPRLKPTKVKHLFQRAIDAHRPAIDAAQVVVRMVGPTDALMVNVDAELLHQALLNLVRNAVDAMETAASERVLSLHAVQHDDRVVLSVRDTGPGIADESIDRIFNPFFTTRNTGTGLGLAIVHRIVDAHSGTITVHNDGGAVFELSLPAGPGGSVTRE